MRKAADELTPRLQEHATRRGVSGELVNQLRVRYDGGGFTAGVADPEHQQAFDDHEWGSEEQPPTAFVRTFEPALAEAFKDTLHGAILSHLARR